MDTRQLTPTNRPLIGSGPQGRAVLAPAGELDEAASAVLRADACGLVAHGHRNLVVDLSAVTFCDACSLSALIGIRRHALEAGGSLVLAAVPDQLRELLSRTGLDTVLTVHPTVHDALAHPGRPLAAPPHGHAPV
ncbi:STAS domain-containing protein [Uniformispora flossi]|uniref:STAS domain-containing protein n=1 Tax=Uniformispora flossi TaxID=3390723 RepID=UPI003C2D31CE